MAQRKKRPTVRKGKSTARRKARKPSKSAQRSAKRSVARATPRKYLTKGRLKRVAKKVARKKVKAMKPPSTPAVETVVVDVIEEPVAGVTVVTEFEAKEVREPRPRVAGGESVRASGTGRTIRVASPARRSRLSTDLREAGVGLLGGPGRREAACSHG